MYSFTTPLFHKFVFSLLIILFFSCSGADQNAGESKFRIGIVFGEGGKDDLSFNANAWQGAVRAQKDFNVEIRDVEGGDPSTIESAVRTFAEQKYDLIVGIGFPIKNAIEKIAPQFPDDHFVIADPQIDLPNVASLVFEENEGSFLVGVIAASLTKTGTVGFVGGMKMPLIERAFRAYKAGAIHQNPNVSVLENYAGVTPGAFSDPAKGKELALAQIAQNADIIYQAAGATGMGVFDAVGERNKFAIGSDSNQNRLKPGNILTSMLKNLDVALYEFIKNTIENSFKPGIHEFNLANNGVGYAVDEHNKDLLPEEVIKKVEDTKAAIIAGSIEVPDYQ